MNRSEFLQQLEWLLQDIPEEEREGALEYYRDYFDEAGVGEQDETGDKLGSPEKAAALVKDGLFEENDNAGEYTDTGYQDRRFEENRNMPERRDAFEKESKEEEKKKEASREKERQGSAEQSRNYWGSGLEENYQGNGYQGNGYQGNSYQGDGYQGNGYQGNSYQGSSYQNNGCQKEPASAGKIILIVLLCILAIPVGIPVVAVIFALAAAIFGVAVGIAIAAFGLLLAGFISGIIFLGIGIAQMFTTPAIGFLFTGLGLLALALGFLMVWITVLIAGRFVPWLIRGIVSICSIPFHRRGGQAV